ncbi:MAG TPA: tetratricopeptide repeat protein [Myxococcota bacterium]|nr:tetratricopeptide repeat protein [Myxococcota bacterium]HRY92092.1 tetratricopeptide repeat protein [Myxococcota bacterium]
MRSCWPILALWGAGLLTTGCTVIEARSLAREGNEAYLASDYRTAILKYEEALKLDPETPNLYLNLGYAYFSVYDPASEKPEDRAAAKAAVEAFERHLQKVPGDDSAKVFRIKTLLKSAPFEKELADKALSTFLDMLKQDPQDHEARQYLITLFIDCRRYEDAVAFFQAKLDEKKDDIETMKILAIIADKSKQTQAALEWYWRRAETVQDQEKKATLFYEVGTYAWNLLHYQPDRVKGVDALKLADQGTEACLRAIKLKDKYAEAMIYANLLYLKRVGLEPDEQSRFFSQNRAFELRKTAGEIMLERKQAEEAAKGGAAAPGAPASGPEAAPAGSGSEQGGKPSN